MSLIQPDSKPEPAPDVPTGTIHDILRNDRRRAVMETLSRSGGPITVRSLAERIVADESNQTLPPAKHRKSVYNSLNQTHLPKLDHEGVIDYDTDRKLVIPREQARDVGRYLEVTTPYGGSWSTYYRTLATAFLMLVLLSLLEVPLVGSIDPLLWTVLGLCAVTVSTIYQLWRLRWLYLPAILSRNADQ
ncbi:MAG: hypothetical protein V5A34_05695 [Halapricum sp.]